MHHDACTEALTALGGARQRPFVISSNHVAQALVVADDDVFPHALEGRNVIVIHSARTSTGKAAMWLGLLGEAVLTSMLVQQAHKPATVTSLIVCDRRDNALPALLEAIGERVERYRRGGDPSYDVHEFAALTWAISIIEEADERGLLGELDERIPRMRLPQRPPRSDTDAPKALQEAA